MKRCCYELNPLITCDKSDVLHFGMARYFEVLRQAGHLLVDSPIRAEVNNEAQQLGGSIRAQSSRRGEHDHEFLFYNTKPEMAWLCFHRSRTRPAFDQPPRITTSSATPYRLTTLDCDDCGYSTVIHGLRNAFWLAFAYDAPRLRVSHLGHTHCAHLCL